MDVIILAGGQSSDDPLSAMTQGGLKSMLPIAGKPMVQWVLDAVSGAKLIDTVVLIGIEDLHNLKCGKPLIGLPDEGTLMGNIQQGARKLNEIHPNESHVMSISADIPAITSTIVDELAGIYQKGEFDIYYGVLSREVMEKRYPGSKRTYIKAKNEEVCGGDANAFRKQAALDPNALWKELIKSRKNPLKQAGMIGFDSLLGLLLGFLTIDQVANRVCQRLGITGKAVRLPYAEVGMDVDKPFQFEMVEADLLR
jgi:molybdopterin-guanine dinucleotide biosynthesis protein A